MHQLRILPFILLLVAGSPLAEARSDPAVALARPASADTAIASPKRNPGAANWSRFWGSRPFRWATDSTLTRSSQVSPAGAMSWAASVGDTAQPTVNPSLWGVNGNILGLARSGNTLYIAGSFRSVGENSGGFVPVDAGIGEALRPFPKVAGSVYAIVPDGSGGWYIGGEFTAVGGKPRSCLAQVRADGSLSDWNPSVTGSPGYIDPPAVSAIAVSGGRVFVGGGFREIGGQAHENLGCVDARTGGVLNWDLDINADGWIYTFAVHGSTVFVGGTFTSIGGQTRGYLAAIDAATGAVLPWQADADYSVLTLLACEGTLYVGGQFGWIAGRTQPYLAALDIGSAQLLPFDAGVQGIYVDYTPTPRVSAIALAGDTLYAAGNFTQAGGQSRASLAALNASTGDLLPWIPADLGPQYEGFPPPLCEAVAVSGGAVYVGGWFETVGGESRPFVAALSKESGAATAWNPRPDLAVYALAAKGDTVRLGGDFSLVGEWKHRAGLAAIDLACGTLKPWNPNPDGSICTAIALSGDRVLVSGDFANIGGQPQPRRFFAALDTLNGEVLGWNPGANQIANVLLLVGDTLYAGGYFTQIGGQTRNYIAAVNATTGEVTGWNPNASWPVLTMARRGGTIFVGGSFGSIGNMGRRGIAAIDAATGDLLPWISDTDNGIVEAIKVSGNVLYVGGKFGEIGGQPRRSLAALDVTTGEAIPWYPQPTAWGSPTEVKALAVHDSTVYIGGVFGTMGGQPRICLASVDTSSGYATDWDPGADGYVWSLLADGNNLFVGGGFTRVAGIPCSGLAAFTLPQPPPRPPIPSRLAIGMIRPNPLHSTAILRFALPSSEQVDLDVYDVRGRHVATILHDQVRAAGEHDVLLDASRWPLGLYVCRLAAAGATATGKLLVIR